MLSLSGVHSVSNVEFAHRNKQTESEHTDNLNAITESPSVKCKASGDWKVNTASQALVTFKLLN